VYLEARDPFSVRHHAKKTAGFVLKGTLMGPRPYADLEYQGHAYLLGEQEHIGDYTVVRINDSEVYLRRRDGRKVYVHLDKNKGGSSAVEKI
jgi:hypothetical protein